jgi:F-type H+-transporting ATPase subunit epsilon
MAGTFHVAVVTPEREVLALEARAVTLPAYDGEMGILARRAPLLTQLGSGELRVEAADGGKRALFVSGGFAQMVENRLTVLTEEALEPAALTREAARSGLARAASLPNRSEAEHERRQRAADRARALGRLAR